MTHVLKPVHVPRALNSGTCINSDDEQGALFYSTGPRRNQCLSQLTQERLGRGFGKNASKWTGRVEISKEEIPGQAVFLDAVTGGEKSVTGSRSVKVVTGGKISDRRLRHLSWWL